MIHYCAKPSRSQATGCPNASAEHPTHMSCILHVAATRGSSACCYPPGAAAGPTAAKHQAAPGVHISRLHQTTPGCLHGVLRLVGDHVVRQLRPPVPLVQHGRALAAAIIHRKAALAGLDVRGVHLAQRVDGRRRWRPAAPRTRTAPGGAAAASKPGSCGCPGRTERSYVSYAVPNEGLASRYIPVSLANRPH